MSRFIALTVTFFVVVMIAVGQIAFKLAANRVMENPAEAWFRQWLNSPMIAALLIYGIATGIWVWVLRYVPLNVAYPVFALAFLMVPVMTYFFLGEPIGWRHFVGGALIVAGVIVTSWE